MALVRKPRGEGQRTPPASQAAERQEQIAGLPVFWREAPALTSPPALYLHGVPTAGDDFGPFLARIGGIAPDLPGFGRSGKPAEYPYSIEGYARFVEGFLDHLGLERASLVMHDWGAAALALAQRRPELVGRLVLIDALPLLPGYRPHRLARIWATPGLGELAMGLTTRRLLARASRGASAGGRPMRDELLERTFAHFDHGTQRAILKLYRSARPDDLARAGEGLGQLAAPALVVWGAEDPYVPASFAAAYGRALGGPTRVEVVEGASHWPWLDRPGVVDTLAEFLLARG